MTKPTIITEKLPDRHVPLAQALDYAAKKRGISRWRIGFDIVKRLYGRQRLLPNEYFIYGLHRGELSDAERGAFLGGHAITAMNTALMGGKVRALGDLIRDKVKMAMVLERAGLPTTEIRAIYVRYGTPGPWPILRKAEDIAAYLLTAGNLPLFGKPLIGSRSVGALSILAAHGDQLELGDGRRVLALTLAQEIVTAFDHGYIFQELLRPLPEIEAVSGPATASLRVFTLWQGAEPVPMYLMIRLPGKGAMADDLGTGSANTVAVVDMKSGHILRAHYADQLGGTTVDLSPVTGVQLVGARVPDVEKIIQLAVQAHRMFAEHAAIGADIVLTDRGPIINELNANPGHGNFQRATGTGILNPAFRPMFVAALAEKGITKPQRGLPLP